MNRLFYLDLCSKSGHVECYGMCELNYVCVCVCFWYEVGAAVGVAALIN